MAHRCNIFTSGNLQILIRCSVVMTVFATYFIFKTSFIPVHMTTEKTKREHRRNFVETQTKDIFLYSAYIDRGESSVKGTKQINTTFQTNDKLIVVGWQNKNLFSKKLKCCILDSRNNTVTSHETASDHCCYAGSPEGKHVTFPLNGIHTDIIGITLAVVDVACSVNRSHYITPTMLNTSRKRNTIAVCSNTNLYGSVSAKRLIEWFEIHRFLGVDKFTFHPHPTLGSSARRVLRFYEKEGLADVFELDNPIGSLQRGVHETPNYYQQWNDEQVGLFDCRERHKYYEFEIDVDIDELLFTTDWKENAYKSILTDIFRRKNVGVVSFYVSLHTLELKPVNANHSMIFGRNEIETEPIIDRLKNMYMPDRTQLSKGYIHRAEAKPGFSTVFVDHKVATIHHFRACSPGWMKGKTLKIYRNGRLRHETKKCDTFQRNKSESLKRFLNSKVINDNVQKVCSTLKICS